MDEKEYEQIVRERRVWKALGCRLSCSGDAIMAVVRQDWPREGSMPDRLAELKIPQRLHVAQMLYGLALENGLKARLVETRPELVEICVKPDKDGNPAIAQLKWKELGDGHDLVALAKAVRLMDVHTGEHIPKLLAFLSQCVRWASRYPVPKRIEIGATNGEYEWRPGVVYADMDRQVTPMLEDLLYENGQPVWLL